MITTEPGPQPAAEVLTAGVRSLCWQPGAFSVDEAVEIMRRFSGKLRRPGTWVPVGAVIGVGAVLAGTVLASASGPDLPHRTPAQLLAAMQRAKLPPAATAVISETANLGFPALPEVAGLPSSALSAASWLAGSHTIQVWYDGPRHVRIALPVPFGETDLRVNGSQVWLWNAGSQTATHVLPPAVIGRTAGPFRTFRPPPACLRILHRHIRPNLRTFEPSRPVRLRIARACLPMFIRLHRAFPRGAVPPCVRRLFLHHPAHLPSPVGEIRPLTPLQAARRLLALVGPTTKVSVAGTTVVAGRPAYQLAIAPRSSQSLVGQILIAVDSTTFLPLQVQVVARGASSPAFSIGFTSLRFGRPAGSNFAFTPPPGAHVKVVRLPNPLAGLPVPIAFPGRLVQFVPMQWHVAGRLPGKVLRRLRALPCQPPRIGAFARPPGPRVLDSGWLAVAAFPLPRNLPALHQPWLSVLLKSAARVHGAWGSGRLLRTALFSVLITSKGQVLAGAVTPAVLYADAATLR